MRTIQFFAAVILCATSVAVSGQDRRAARLDSLTSTPTTVQPLRPARNGNTAIGAAAVTPSTMAFTPPTGAAYSAGALNGRYILSYRGKDNAGVFIAGGYIDLDGAGAVDGVGFATTTLYGTLSPLYFTGTYVVYADGHGILKLNIWDAPNNLIVRTAWFELQVVSNSLAYISGFDQYNVGSGAIERQSGTAGLSAYSGTFVFSLSGDDTVYPLSLVGRLSMSALSQNTSAVASGTYDMNDGGTVYTQQSLTGTVLQGVNGFASATVTFAGYPILLQLYAVTNDRIVVVSADPLIRLNGLAERQSSPGSAVSGKFAFRGAAGTDPVALVGELNFAPQSVSGTIDDNDLTSEWLVISGTGSQSAVDATGRSTFWFDNVAHQQRLFTAYWVSAQKAYWLQTGLAGGSPPVASGVLQSPDAGAFDSSNVSGRYHLLVSGVHGGNPTTVSASLQLSPSVFTGLLNANDNFSMAADTLLEGTYGWTSSRGLLTASSSKRWSLWARSTDELYVYGKNTVGSTTETVTGVLAKANPPTLSASANLSLSVAVNDAPTALGYVTFTATLTNNGPGTATGVWLTDTLPTGLVITAPPITKGTCGDTVLDDPIVGKPATLYCRIGSLAPGEQVTWTLTTTATRAGAVTNVMQAALNESDPDATDNAAYTQVTVANPTPVLDSIYPNHVIAGSAGFELTLGGDNFLPGTQVYWNGVLRAPTTLYKNFLTVHVDPADISAVGTVSVSAFNPSPGGGSTRSFTFTIDPKPPVAVSTNLLNFNGVMFYAWSEPRSLTLFNNQNTALTISAIEVPPEFAYSTDCGAQLLPGANCTVTVQWRPCVWGQDGTLRIVHDAANGPTEVTLAGYTYDYYYWLAQPGRPARAPLIPAVPAGRAEPRGSEGVMEPQPVPTPDTSTMRRPRL